MIGQRLQPIILTGNHLKAYQEFCIRAQPRNSTDATQKVVEELPEFKILVLREQIENNTNENVSQGQIT